MRITVRKWGNSLAVRIPKTLADMTAIAPSSQVELTAEGGRLVITPVPGEQTLRVLVGGITEDNRHGEISLGRSRGREIW